MMGAVIGGFIQGSMTGEEHTAVFQAMAESIVAEPPAHRPGLDERVVKGCEVLDRDHPGWADRINLRTFDIRDGDHCVLGQAFGGYNEESLHTVLGIDEEDGDDPAVEEEHGFCVYAENHDSGWRQDDDWTTLQKDWVIAIRERQDAS